MNIKKNKKAFTMAEALIILVIVGFIAAITLPNIVKNITDKVYSTREKNISYKVSQAVLVMKALGLLNDRYDSTDDFVDELQKHLKITKRCDSEHLTECWPSERVTNKKNEVYEVENAKNGQDLHVFSSYSDNVGLILADGSSIILSYTPIAIDMIDSEERALSTIDFVMDVNGGMGPNSESTGKDEVYDIRSFRNANFGGCTHKFKGECVIYVGKYNYTNGKKRAKI